MSGSPKDALLQFGNLLARVLQALSVVAGAIVLVLIPVVLLARGGMLSGINSGAIKASPLAVIAILTMLALILAALFQFFGKLRAIILSASEGDPFTPENANRLSAMAWLFLGVKLLYLLVGAVRLHVANIIDQGAGGDRLNLSLYDLNAVVIVIVLFILARIFRHGAAMRDDLKGTV